MQLVSASEYLLGASWHRLGGPTLPIIAKVRLRRIERSNKPFSGTKIALPSNSSGDFRVENIAPMFNSGHCVSFRAFVGDGDADATVWAKQLVDDRAIELRSGDRLMIRLETLAK
jgi:hypothetical protein